KLSFSYPISLVTMTTSAHAKQHWYCGLTGEGESDPVLIARSSTETYRYESHHFRFWFPNGPEIPEYKVMSAIGTHPILAAYDKHLRSRVLEVLAPIPWQTVDIVRIGFADNEDNPPVVLVTIKEEDVEENLVQAAVDQIRIIMVENGFLDVHAEAKTGMLYSQLTYNVDEVVPLKFKQTPKVGCSIGNACTGAGTLCLYVKIQGEMYGLTCKHVLLPMGLTTPAGPISDHSTVAVDGAMVLQPAVADFDEEETILKERIACCQSWLDDFIVEEKNAKMGLTPPIRQARRHDVQRNREWLDELKAEKAHFDSFKPFMPFGTVHTVPGSLRNPVHSCARDWLLFKLFEDRFREPPRNIGGILQFTGSDDHNKNRAVRVAKHGRSTGWTCGTLNELRSNCRVVLPGKADLITTEWCVFNVPHAAHFSSKGDSGAAVIDFGGKIVGMVHRCNAKSERYRAEITYVTPMDWIIEDIKATMGTDDVTLEDYIWDGVGETGN
ncbi:hypothetical protein V502_00513, partial [Pseudogymnoascus sp. VKM F-4520 (FW-2644)]